MADTLVELVNEALSIVGYPAQVTNLSTNSQDVMRINALLKMSIRTILNKYPFQEAVDTIYINAVGVPDSSGKRKYQLPNNRVRVTKVYATGKFRTERSFIIGPGSETLKIKYIFYNDDPSSWGVDLEDCIRGMLCHHFAHSLLKDKEGAAYYEQQVYRVFLPEAKHNQGNANSPPESQNRYAGSYSNARKSGGGRGKPSVFVEGFGVSDD